MKTKSIIDLVEEIHIPIDYSCSCNSGLPYILFSNLPHTAAAEKAATNLTHAILGEKMLVPLTLNNWKDSILQIRFATTTEELNWLIEGYLSDKKDINCSGRSLLY